MISGQDIYRVLSAIVPLYISIFLGYSSIRIFKILTLEQCPGINRYVALMAVPVLGFKIIATTNVYEMNFRFLGADSICKLAVLAVLFLWAYGCPPRTHSRAWVQGWVCTIFMISVLPNTLIIGVPLLSAMYGPEAGNLMAQIVVFQVAIWFPFVLLMFALTSARKESLRQLSRRISLRTTSAAAASAAAAPAALPDTGSHDCSAGAHHGVEGGSAPEVTAPPSAGAQEGGASHSGVESTTCAEFVGEAGVGMQQEILGGREGSGGGQEQSRTCPGGGHGGQGADMVICLGQRDVAKGRHDTVKTVDAAEAADSDESREPRLDEMDSVADAVVLHHAAECQGSAKDSETVRCYRDTPACTECSNAGGRQGTEEGTTQPESQWQGPEGATGTTASVARKSSMKKQPGRFSAAQPNGFCCNATACCHHAVVIAPADDDASEGEERSAAEQPASTSGRGLKGLWRRVRKSHQVANEGPGPPPEEFGELPPDDWWDGASFATTKDLMRSLSRKDRRALAGMTFRILGIKLLKNPNNYAALLGVAYSLLSFGLGFGMPDMLRNSVDIVANTGLGMAMFSLGLFMASQRSLVPCGMWTASWTLALRFVAVPLLMAGVSVALGIRGDLFRIAVVQAALPPGVATFVFANEYKVNPQVLSTGVSFGTLISFPILIVLYVLLGL